jgi:SPP1 family holin
MSKGTIVRTIMLAIVLINMGLQALGKDVLKVQESEVSNFVTYVIELAIIIEAWWKNNSFSKHAIMADEIMKKIKAGESVSGQEED